MSERRPKLRERSKEDTWRANELKQFMGKKSDSTSQGRKEGHKAPPDTKKSKYETKSKEQTLASSLVPKDSRKSGTKHKQTLSDRTKEMGRKQEPTKPRTETKNTKIYSEKSETNLPLGNQVNPSLNPKMEPSNITEDFLDTIVPHSQVAQGHNIGSASDFDDVASYDEDFESYDEDFEEVSSGSGGERDTLPSGPSETTPEPYTNIDLIKQAIEFENLNVAEIGGTDSDPSGSQSSLDKTQTQITGKGFISFHIPKAETVANEEVVEKTHTRLRHLMPLLQLDFESMELFDIPPLSEYDVYVKQFGFEMTRQMAVQSDEDTFECDTQTDTIITRAKWTQHSTEGGECSCGGHVGDTIETQFDSISNLSGVGENSSNFLSFFYKTSQIMCIVLEENTQNVVRNVSQPATQPLFKFTQSNSMELAKIPILEGRQIVSTNVSLSQPNSLLIAYAPIEQSSFLDTISRKGILAFWNINDPYQPKRLMECDSTPTCCCLSPQRVFLAFAGMEDGSISLWDFRDTSDPLIPSHKQKGYTLRPPSFSTAMFSTHGSHFSAITSIVAIFSSKGVNGRRNDLILDDISTTGLSFQIATADIQGVINIWVVAEITNPDICGSLTDLGIAPGSRVKLIRTTSISIVTPARVSSRLKSKVAATLLKFHPTDLSHYYVGTEDGLVIHGSRYTPRPTPKCYAIKSQKSSVTSLDFHPIKSDYFVVSYAEGNFALFNREKSEPILVAESGEIVSLKRVMWSRVHPLVLYTLNEDKQVSVWDLSANHCACILKEQLNISSQNPIEILDFDLIPERTQLCRDGELVLTLSDGSCQIHPLLHQGSVSGGVSSDLEAFTNFVTICEKFIS